MRHIGGCRLSTEPEAEQVNQPAAASVHEPVHRRATRSPCHRRDSGTGRSRAGRRNSARPLRKTLPLHSQSKTRSKKPTRRQRLRRTSASKSFSPCGTYMITRLDNNVRRGTEPSCSPRVVRERTASSCLAVPALKLSCGFGVGTLLPKFLRKNLTAATRLPVSRSIHLQTVYARQKAGTSRT